MAPYRSWNIKVQRLPLNLDVAPTYLSAPAAIVVLVLCVMRLSPAAVCVVFGVFCSTPRLRLCV